MEPDTSTESQTNNNQTTTEDPTDALVRLLGGTDDDLPKQERRLSDEANEPEETKPDEPAKFKVKVDGKELEVTQDELLAGYSRQGDYSKKTAELAQQRQQLEQAAQAVAAERQQYQAHLAQMAQALGAQLQDQSKIDWQHLLNNDPQEYLKQRHLFETRQAALQNAQRAQQQALSEAQQAQVQQHHQRLQSEQQALLDKLPDWKDADKAKAEQAQISVYLKSSGFNDDEVNGVSDHRAVLMARKAMLYDALQAKAAASTQKVQNLPAPKVLRPGNTEVSATDGRTRAMKTLARTGSTDAAADVLMSLMGGARG